MNNNNTNIITDVNRVLQGSVAVGPWIGGKSKLVALVGLGPRKALPLSAVKVMQARPATLHGMIQVADLL